MPEQTKTPEADKNGLEAAEARRLSGGQIAVELREKIRSKMDDYAHYDFNSKESCALNIFFDLAQEYMNLSFTYPLAVEILDMFFNVPAELYTKGDGEVFKLRTACVYDGEWDIKPEDLVDGNFTSGRRVCLIVRGRYNEKEPDRTPERDIRGALVLYPEEPLSQHELMFMEKFANRIGWALHNHLLMKKDRDHIDFVRNLVKDVGHNVLGPNMYFKLLINKLESGILDFGKTVREALAAGGGSDEAIKEKHLDLIHQLDEIQQHFSHSSLFLESLLRESHFAHGRYVLRSTCMNLYERVVLSQYNRFASLLNVRRIKSELVLKDKNLPLVEADCGLISQVVSNYFSNALKYASTSPESPSPFMRCTVSLVGPRDWPGREGGKLPGIRVDVLTSGPRLKPDEAARMFEKYFRAASNTWNIPGTGKGLHFVKTIVAQHNGVTGYEPAAGGNLFYFILPAADCRLGGEG